MKNDFTTAQQLIIRHTYENISVVINALQVTEQYSGTDDLAAANILLCRRQLAKSIDSLSEQFGADWPENQ